MKYDMPSCGGCRTCEMACSYHHTGEFMPSVSSLIVVEKEDGKGCMIELLERKVGERFACDGCEGLDDPLCIEWCRQQDEFRGILNHFLKQTEQAGTSK